MFKILAADQKEYGPVSTDQIRQWIAQGRANANTKVQSIGSPDWKLLAEFPEFADALRPNALPAGQPPPMPISPPSTQPKTSALGITALVLGCLGLFTCGITSLAGLVVGIIALMRINKSRGQLGGKGIALAGTIVSAAFLLLMPIPAALLLPALAKAKQKAASISCMSNVKQLGLGVMMYANDHKDAFPSGTNWCDLLLPYIQNPSTYLCAQGKLGQRSHYALNARLAGRELRDLQSPAQTVMIFETDGGWNVTGGRERFPALPRHASTYTVCFADGHSEMVVATRLPTLRWDP